VCARSSSLRRNCHERSVDGSEDKVKGSILTKGGKKPCGYRGHSKGSTEGNFGVSTRESITQGKKTAASRGVGGWDEI